MRMARYGVVFSVGLLFAFVVQSSGALSSIVEQSTFKALDRFSWAFEQIRSQYVEPTQDDAMIDAAVQGMLSSLDPHSSWLNAADYQSLQSDAQGAFGGLGIEVTVENGVIKVVSPIDDTPASRAGVRPGDYITHLDGMSVQGLPLRDAVERMRGPEGAPIRLTLVRAGVEQPLEVTLVRERIKVRSVWRRLEEGRIGYLRIAQFSEQTQPGLDAALKALNSNPSTVPVAYVLDLRNNPGGTLDAAVSVADTFLDRGLIVSTRGRDPKEVSDIRAHPGDAAKGAPLVVLINDGSASAAEIVAGALQDQARGLVMGVRSFGKGSVQRIFPAPFPKSGAIKLTTQRYYTPSGRSIQGRGVDPDIVVPQALVEALESDPMHEEDLRNALKNETTADAASDTPAPAAPLEPGVAPQAAEEDYQLARALDMARALARYRHMTMATAR